MANSLENDIPDPRCLTCEVDVVPAVTYARPDHRCSPTPIWTDGIDDDSGTLNDCVDVIRVYHVHDKCRNLH